MAEDLGAGVSLDIADDVAVITLDDGKANAVGHPLVDAVHDALDRAENDAKAVVIAGREGRFCAGFDLAVMGGDDADAAKELLRAGAELALRIYLHPQPVVAACTGHALAMGAILLMACDTCVGAEGDFKIGTNEVSIGMQLPRFAVELARDRLSRRHFQTATQYARVYDPMGAADAGYLDRVVPADQVVAEAVADASIAAATLHPNAFRRTRGYVRGEVGRAVAEGLDRDMGDFEVG